MYYTNSKTVTNLAKISLKFQQLEILQQIGYKIIILIFWVAEHMNVNYKF